MKKRDLNQFISPVTLKHNGNTLKAVYACLLDGLSVAEAANKAGVSRQAANASIRAVERKLHIAGWRTKIVWVRPL